MFEKAKSFFGSEDKTMPIKFDRTITVGNYKPGGDSNNLQVVQVEAYIAHISRSKGIIFDKSDVGVKPMMCVATIDPDDKKTRKLLKDACPSAPDDMVICVNKKFMSFFTFGFNVYREAALEGLSAKANALGTLGWDGGIEVIEQAEVARWVAARQNHTNHVVNHAFSKVDKDLAKQCGKFATVAKKEKKKNDGFYPMFNHVQGAR